MTLMSYWVTSVVVILIVASTSYLVGREIADRGAGIAFAPMGDASAVKHSNEAHSASQAEDAHIYFLLDRSGSMSAISNQVIEGFNSFVKEQRAVPGRLRMTLLQFDEVNPHEVVFEGRDVRDVPLLTADTFQPRSLTPLFDAIGHTLALAERAQVPHERLVIVAFSDGKENASREHTRKSIFKRISEKRAAGWTFVFLGANQDSYAEGGTLGFGDKNTQNFAFDGRGADKAFSSVSKAVMSMRFKADYDSEDFFEGEKSAEADYRARSR